MQQNADLFQGIDSPSQAYTVYRHLEDGNETLATLAAAYPVEIFQDADKQIQSAFLLGVLMGLAANI
ncbi:hypothetical protein [Leisingera methylohalidivorans]|uniref:hypothetical protein n=1 Tax=Leisingera methylohalidivorans TaxID=133924 RepID=UPI0003FA0558|nr:hypothetical protein [Leisingera methylohalidivorans]